MSNTPIKGHQTVEALDAPAWRQTLKDFPVAVLATGIGYGLGKTVTDIAKSRIATGSAVPKWLQYTPQTVAVLSAVSSVAAARARGVLRDRREAARREEALKTAAAALGKR
jgi:hypothetical protein